MKKVKARKNGLLAMFVVAFCCISSNVSAQYSEKVAPISEEKLAKAQQILKPKLNLLSFSHLDAQHCYHPTLGAFCILENKIEKKATFPVKMRLGSVDYVDMLENKRQ